MKIKQPIFDHHHQPYDIESNNLLPPADIDESELGPSGPCSSAEMEEAVAIHDALILPHARSHNTHNSHGTHGSHSTHGTHGTQAALGGSSSTLGKKETHDEKVRKYFNNKNFFVFISKIFITFR